MSHPRYFSAESAHGSESSHGFSNDTIVRVFSGKSARDKYVSESRNISCRAIPANDATKQAANWSMAGNCSSAPRPFSGEFWGIVESYLDDDLPEGCIGRLECCSDNDCMGNLVERFYR